MNLENSRFWQNVKKAVFYDNERALRQNELKTCRFSKKRFKNFNPEYSPQRGRGCGSTTDDIRIYKIPVKMNKTKYLAQFRREHLC